MTNNKMNQPSFSVLQGREECAVYRDLSLPGYEGNPLIEALPEILSKGKTAERLAFFPPYNEEHRSWPPELRLHLVTNTLKFFMPLSVHIDLAGRIGILILLSYEARNPSKPGFWQNNKERADSINLNSPEPESRRSTAKGLTILGISGVGKTTAIESILLLYPQVINHSYYRDRELTLRQIVWLKLECPHDGSIKGLCLSFFQAIDSILGTSYYKNYASGRRTTDELIPDVARVASNQCLGLLVIDEIQNLSEAKSGGSTKMLSFFVQMINTIGISVVLVGTYKAWSVLSGEFRQMRRGTGVGDLVWDPMKEDETWQTFVKALWRYQYVERPCPLTPELSKALYYESQGITDFAVKVYMLAQMRAIQTGREKVVVATIKSVANDCLRTAREVLNALKQGKLEKLRKYEDVHPLDIEPLVEEAHAKMIAEDQLNPLLDPSLVLGNNKLAKQPQAEPPQHSLESSVSKPAIEQKIASPTVEDKTNKQSRKFPKEASLEGTLPGIVAKGAKQGIAAYEALKLKGYIQAATEYL